jgi:poly-gamma-glutamate capsule biosynthesis protein CapA/YwtB (metallophosphatase superfamily)
MWETSASHVALVGDVMIRTPGIVRERLGDDAFAQTINALGENSFVFANLEMPLSKRGVEAQKWSALRSDPEVIGDVQAMGIDSVSLANNHMMDFGPDALADTIATCKTAGLSWCGAGRDLDAATQPVTESIGSHRIGFLSVACTVPLESAAGQQKPGIFPVSVSYAYEVDSNISSEQPGTMPIVQSWVKPEDQEFLCDKISSLRRQVDVVVVGMHWGVPSYWLSPFQGILATYQQPLGHALIDAGADIVCGHHSHSLHPIEIYKERLILYSLGNFVFEDPRDFMEPESFIVKVTLEGEMLVELVPLMIDRHGFPTLALASTADAVFSKLGEMSETIQSRLQRTGNRARIALA